ncbi:hypothetical protein ABIA06_003253 [Bradyrhizobium yuanmingense]
MKCPRNARLASKVSTRRSGGCNLSQDGMMAIVVAGSHHLGQHVDDRKHGPFPFRSLVGDDLSKHATEEAEIRGNAYGEAACTLRRGRLICLLFNLYLVLSYEGEEPSLNANKRASSTPHRDQRLKRMQYPLGCGFGRCRICVGSAEDRLEGRLPKKDRQIQRVFSVFSHDIEQLSDPVFGGGLVNRRLIKHLPQPLDESRRNTVPDSDLPLPIENGRIFQLLLGSLERGAAAFEPSIRSLSIGFFQRNRHEAHT